LRQYRGSSAGSQLRLPDNGIERARRPGEQTMSDGTGHQQYCFYYGMCREERQRDP
jgi:hypothetical protein